MAVRLMQLFSSSDQNFTKLTRCDKMKRNLEDSVFFQAVILGDIVMLANLVVI